MATSIAVEKNSNHFVEIFANLKIQKQQNFCDVELRISNRTFPAHRHILAACSPYLEEIFKETTSNYIELKDQNPEAVKLILDYVYTGELDLQPNTAIDLLKTSHFFQIKWIKDACVNYLKTAINDYNHMDIYNAAVCCRSGDLCSIAYKYAQKFFSPSSQPNEAVPSLENEERLNVNRATERYSNNVDNITRNEIFIFHWDNSFGFLKLNPNTLQMLDLTYELRIDYFKPVHYKGKIYTVGGFDSTNGQYCHKSYAFDIENNTWDEGELEIPVNRINLGNLVIDDKLYMIGGETLRNSILYEKQATCECFDFNSGNLIQHASMREAKAHLGIVNFGGSIYACGGRICDTPTYTANLERFDPREGTWFLMPAMKGIKEECTAQVYKGNIYAQGRYNWMDCKSWPMEKFSLRANKWVKCYVRFERSLFNSNLVLLNDQLYTVANDGVFHLSEDNKRWNFLRELGNVRPYACIGIN